MDWNSILINILVTPAVTVALLTAVAFLMKTWVTTRLSAQFKKEFELFKQEIAWDDKRKHDAAKIAKVLSLWLRAEHGNDVAGNRRIPILELQEKYWELSLTLEANILKVLNDALTGASKDGLAYKRALIAVRKIYVGNNDPVLPQDLVHWNFPRQTDNT